MRKGGVPGKEVEERRRKADKDEEGYVVVVVVVSGWHSRRFVSSFFLHCTFLSPAAPIPTAPSSVIAPNASTMKRSTLLATLLSAHALLSAIIYSRLYLEQRDRPISLHRNHTTVSLFLYNIQNETCITRNLKTTTQRDSILKDGGASISTVATIFLLKNCPLADCQVSSGPNYMPDTRILALGQRLPRIVDGDERRHSERNTYGNSEKNFGKSVRTIENDRFERN